VTRAELEAYLHQHIPISRAMQVAVVELAPGSVTLRAPLAPNINHRETVFGGSASAVAILAAWSLLHVRLASAGITSRLVIQHNTMSYDLPIAGAFTARRHAGEPAGVVHAHARAQVGRGSPSRPSSSTTAVRSDASRARSCARGA
jgi:thioesterase domain-containing protein